MQSSGIAVSSTTQSVTEKLFELIQYNDSDELEEMLKDEQIDPNSANSNKWSLLHLTCQLGRLCCLKVLLAHPSINVNIRGPERITPLFVAIDCKNHFCVAELLAHPKINVNLYNDQMTTPLHLAVIVGHLESVKLLLQHPKIDTTAKDGNGKTALDICREAQLEKAYEIFRLLSEKYQSDTFPKVTNGTYPNVHPQYGGLIQTVQVVQCPPNNSVQPFDSISTPVVSALPRNQYLPCQFSNGDVQLQTSHDPMQFVPQNTNNAVCINMEPNNSSASNLNNAIPHLLVPTTEDYGNQVTQSDCSNIPNKKPRARRECSPVHDSSDASDTDSSHAKTSHHKHGVRRKRRRHRRDSIDSAHSDATQSHRSLELSKNSSSDASKSHRSLELSKNSSSDASKSHRSLDSSKEASSEDTEEMEEVEEMEEMEEMEEIEEIEDNSKDESDIMTSLHEAALKGNIEDLRAILSEPNINVNKQNKYGNSALHYAAKVGQSQCVKELLKAPGIDVNIKNKSGKTALQLAEESSTNTKQEIIDLIKQCDRSSPSQTL